jgi:hypothetical protein
MYHSQKLRCGQVFARGAAGGGAGAGALALVAAGRGLATGDSAAGGGGGTVVSIVTATGGTIKSSTTGAVGASSLESCACGTMSPEPPDWLAIMVATTAASTLDVPRTAQLALRLTWSPPTLLRHKE